MKRLTAFLKRRWRALLALSILFAAAGTLLAFAFAPGLSGTPLARTLRFWEKAPPPIPAVPAGQLGVEMEQAQAENPNGAIVIDANTAASLGLQTATVESRTFDQPVRTTGRVMPDERRITHVQTKVEGWIEETMGNFEGQQINKGQPLFTLYSPELVATQQEYLIALKARQDFGKSEFEVVRDSGGSLVEATRRRLQLWDLTPQQITELEKTGKVRKAITYFAQASGVITARKAFPGMRVMPDVELYTLADLSTIWVEADVYESDLMNIRAGSKGEVTLPDNSTQTGRVAFINPLIEPSTRTAKVRLEFNNPNLRLKPGMFLNVSLTVKQPPQLVVLRDAVIDTGMRQLVLVDDGDGKFSLREITVGAQGQEHYTVRSGLRAGEKVARNIQYLIDSETQLKQAIEQKTGALAPAGAGGGSRAGHASHGQQ
ncbi:MAG TPA: efflux RND transporter periplasmic adaptor subunit [Blastocatellia bacterium]|nr:efflux RND transporter periplasmic adaptor subunit [Blastocatellia bacterium]